MAVQRADWATCSADIGHNVVFAQTSPSGKSWVAQYDKYR